MLEWKPFEIHPSLVGASCDCMRCKSERYDIVAKQNQQMRAALEEIRADASSKPNGGAWAGGMATLCLGTLTFSARDCEGET